MDERKKIIISILRKQNETKTLLKQNSLKLDGQDNIIQMEELQSKIRFLQSEIKRTNEAYSNIKTRQVIDFLKLVNVIISCLKSERTNTEDHRTRSVVFQTNDFIRLIQQMTHVPNMEISLIDCLTSLLLEMSLSEEGRMKIFQSRLYEFLTRLLHRRDLCKYPVILYRVFNTILNSIKLDSIKHSLLGSSNIVAKMRSWESVVSSDPKLRSKYSVVMSQLTGMGGNVPSTPFLSGMNRGRNRIHSSSQPTATTRRSQPPSYGFGNNVNNNNDSIAKRGQFKNPQVNHSGGGNYNPAFTSPQARNYQRRVPNNGYQYNQ